MMTKSSPAADVDHIEAAVHGALKPKRFRKRGRTFNRTTDDGLVQVIAHRRLQFEHAAHMQDAASSSRVRRTA